MEENKKGHWENVYQGRNAEEVSWTQQVPKTSLDLIQKLNLTKTSKVIDIGGGDSKLVDYLLEKGFRDITVLDISAAALEKARKRLGSKSAQVKWIVSDITDFKPAERYDLWHDRATFHFLTTGQQISTYINIAVKAVSKYLIIGTFSENGPAKCSGLPVKQYSEEQLQNLLWLDFEKIACTKEDHTTPFTTIQNFLFCTFKKRLRADIEP